MKPPSHGAVLSPTDLLVASDTEVLVGGRVADVRGPDLTLIDACSAITASLETESDLHPGDLVVLEGSVSRGDEAIRLSAARLVSRHRPLRDPFAGEVQRLAAGRGRRLAMRARAFAAIRRYFDGAQFVEVDTPQRARTATLDVHVASLPSDDRWLITSPELMMKRLLAGGMSRIYQLGHCFRAGELGALHEPEFTMLEWYRAFSTSDAVRHDTEQVVASVFATVRGSLDLVRADGVTVSVAPPYPRLSVRDAFRDHAGVADAFDLAETDEDAYYELLVARVEPALARLPHPVFLVDFPTVHGALARTLPEDRRAADRFELYVAGVELCNGFGELTDSVEQRRRFEGDRAARRARGLSVPALDERFLRALEEGVPPAGGNALGVDRLLMLACGAESIADVLPFPDDDV